MKNNDRQEALAAFDDLRVFLTAEEAYPAFEKAVLETQSHLRLGFRVFDPRTRLISEEARATGSTWSDLLKNTLDRGVRISLSLTDFDPISRPWWHRGSQRSIREIREMAAGSDNPHLLDARVSMHPARVGLLPRLAIWPAAISELKEVARELNEMDADEATAALADMPDLRPLLSGEPGSLAPRYFPVPPLRPVTHHHKVAVFDDVLAYIGGLDLDNRRRDTKEHDRPAELTWHDVQLMVRGATARDAARFLDTLEDVTNGAAPPDTHVVKRTTSQARAFPLPFLSPKRCLREIEGLHHDAISTAKRLIYLESQYFRDRRLAHALARRVSDNPNLTAILLLPAAPEEVAFEGADGLDSKFGEFTQARSLNVIQAAFGHRLFVGSPAKMERAEKVDEEDRGQLYGAPIVYVHSKVSIFDEDLAIVSSANLNGRSFRWDTEAGVSTRNPQDIEQIRRRVMGHWLPEDADESFFDPATARDAWARLAQENRSLPPEERRSLLLPHRKQPAEEFGELVPGLPEELV